MMERQNILATMGELKLFGMKAAYDEIIKVAVKRAHEPQKIVGDLLSAQIAEKQARSIKYQITIAKLPLAKDVDQFTFAGTPINETLVRDLATGEFLAHQRNVVLVGATGTGKTHLAIGLSIRACQAGHRVVFATAAEWVDRLAAAHSNGRLHDELRRLGRYPLIDSIPIMRREADALDANVRDAVVFELAARACRSMNGSVERALELRKLADQAVITAQATDGQDARADDAMFTDRVANLRASAA